MSFNGKGSQSIVERREDGWSYSIDSTHAPEYVLFTASGNAPSDAMLQSIDDLVAVMDKLMGPGAAFCPLIIDLRQLSPAGLSLPAATKTVNTLARRMTISALVFDPNTSDLIFGFFGMMAGARPHTYVTHSLEEALEKVRG